MGKRKVSRPACKIRRPSKRKPLTTRNYVIGAYDPLDPNAEVTIASKALICRDELPAFRKALKNLEYQKDSDFVLGIFPWHEADGIAY